jgi:DNA-binding transcriptional ArsR family regulator
MNKDRFDSKATLLFTMKNKHRLRILMIVADGEITVNAMAHKMGISQSILSQHLAKLRKGKLVNTRRQAQTIYYSCSSQAVIRLLEALEDIYSNHPARLAEAS